MANNKNLAEHGRATQFPYNNPRLGGRKKKILTILKDKGYSASDINLAMLHLCFSTKKEIKEYYTNKEHPVIIRILAKEFALALKGGGSARIMGLIRHLIGNPTQKIMTNSLPIIPIETKIIG